MDNNLDQNPIPIPNSSLPQPIPEPEDGRKPSKDFILIIVALFILAGGYFIYAKSQNLWPWKLQAPEVKNETTGWPTYTNEKYSYSFKYPYGYIADEEAPWYTYKDIFVFKEATKSGFAGPSSPSLFYVSADPASYLFKDEQMARTLPLQEFTKRIWALNKKEVQPVQGESVGDITPTIIDGKKAFQFSTVGGFYSETGGYSLRSYDENNLPEEYIFLFVDQNDRRFLIRFPASNPKARLILGSFRFIRSALDETANWKTYKNEGYGFEFKYPPNFGIEIGGNTKSELEIDKGKEISGKLTQLAIHPTNAGIGYFPTILLVISSTPRVNYYGGILDKPLYVQDGFYYFSVATEGKLGEFVTEILSTFKFTQ